MIGLKHEASTVNDSSPGHCADKISTKSGCAV